MSLVIELGSLIARILNVEHAGSIANSNSTLLLCLQIGDSHLSGQASNNTLQIWELVTTLQAAETSASCKTAQHSCVPCGILTGQSSTSEDDHAQARTVEQRDTNNHCLGAWRRAALCSQHGAVICCMMRALEYQPCFNADRRSNKR